MSGFVDKTDGTHYEDYRSYVEGMLGLCGCRSDDIVDDIVGSLDAYLTATQARPGPGRDRGAASPMVWYDDLPVEGPPKYRELLLHVLDHAGLLEHGGSVRGSWLTDKGVEVAIALRAEGEVDA